MIVHHTGEDIRPLKHIAFIMDGNGRWAKKRGMPREYGHTVGVKTFRHIAEYCFKGGIETVTVYALSTENWKRPKREVDAILKIFDSYLKIGMAEMAEDNIRIRFLGDKSAFSPQLQKSMTELEEASKANKYSLNIAANYGGRAEIVNAVNRLVAEGVTEFTEDLISSSIYTKDQSDPDLIVRTGGEMRLSNFLTWQSTYSELYFCDVLWPDLSENDIDLAVENYYNRKRRFGGV